MCWFWIWKPSYSIGSGLFAIPVLEVPGTFLYWAGSVVLSWDKRLLAVLPLLRYNISAEIFWKFQRYWDIFLRYSIFWDVFLGCIAVNIFRAHTSIESHGTSRKKIPDLESHWIWKCVFESHGFWVQSRARPKYWKIPSMSIAFWIFDVKPFSSLFHKFSSQFQIPANGFQILPNEIQLSLFFYIEF